jgi:uncharacterized alpha/beta hydrolase family protein
LKQQKQKQQQKNHQQQQHGQEQDQQVPRLYIGGNTNQQQAAKNLTKQLIKHGQVEIRATGEESDNMA